MKKRHFDDGFLNPKYEDLSDPNNFKDMGKAVNRIKTAIENHEKILIYGDYDVDGITASALMEEALKLAGIKDIEIMLPDRFVDGYGMSPRLVTEAVLNNIKLVITVDCGSKNHDIVKQLRESGIDTIITDHHECDDGLPDAIAVLNPKRKDQNATVPKNLAGVGVAFRLAEALTKANIIPNGQEKWLLDLVLIGTICDRMELDKENRILCYFGLIVLNKTRRKGLLELIRIADVKSLTAHSIGFQLGPRLNAAGRLETAMTALDLLRTEESSEAAALAKKLDDLNSERKKAQNAALKEIETRGIDESEKVIVAAGPWHEGVIGIVAGRLVEKYHKPAFVLAEAEPGEGNGNYKGSGRSFGDFNLADAINDAIKNQIVEKGGGHAAAAGITLKKSNLNNFREQINSYYKNLNLLDQSKYLKQSADLDADGFIDFTLELTEDLKKLEPYGPGNPEPIFGVTAEIVDLRIMGSEGNHLRVDAKGADGKVIKLIAFSAPKNWFNLERGETHYFLVQPTENEFRGTRSVEAYLLDVR